MEEGVDAILVGEPYARARHRRLLRELKGLHVNKGFNFSGGAYDVSY